MRKAQKKQAEDFVELLGQAHDEIRKEIEKKNIPTVLSLLADCQEGAMSLGDLIEKTEGEEAAAIPLLERYCEEIYRVHEDLAQGNPIGANKVYKNLRQWTLKIKSSIKNEIKTRLEVAFLPYKASMWDSLESVWKAADEDPDCDAYVIPIPYYDKKPDGSFGEMHNEFSQYPSYVPLTWYADYDFEKRRPDMIFIHNPYDENNYVTSVEPFFYSKNLKKYTEKLVYIPYFVLGEIDSQDKKALEGIEKFCLVPGVMYADQVIVQSEDMRQAYINVLTEFMAGQKGYERAYWEKKILGLGSPKVDKVLSTRKEDLEIPEEWLKIIRKPDGSWKKIIFYNTTVTALLEHNEQYLVKMRDVIRVFYENREEVALLWRPHPLMQATLESMRPELLEEYRGIVEEYRKAGWGIYDDTVDMDRAVCLSDGYYGDSSSVTTLVEYSKKLVLVQKPEIESDKNNFARFNSMLKINNKMLVFSTECNALYEIDLSNGTIGFVESFKDEDFFQTNLCCCAIRKKDDIVFFPCFGKKIHILDGSDYHEIRNFSFRSCEDYEKALFFAGEYDGNVYLITYDMVSMYKYNVESHDVKKISIGLEKMDDDFFPKSAFVQKGKIYVVGRKSPFIICINLIGGESTIQKVLGEEGFEGIVVYDDFIYLLPREKTYVISLTDKKIEYYEIIEPIREMAGCIIKNGYWMFGNNGSKELIIFDFIHKQVTYKTVSEDLHWGSQASRDNPYCFIYGKNHFGYYVDNNVERILKLSLKSESAMQMVSSFALNGNLALCEINEGITLETLLTCLGSDSNYGETDEKAILCGKEIYKVVSINERAHY